MTRIPCSASCWTLPLLALIAVIPPATCAQEKPAPARGTIASQIQPFVDNQTLAGTVLLVAGPDMILDVETVGFADVAGKKPMRPDSLFWIASMSKSITA